MLKKDKVIVGIIIGLILPLGLYYFIELSMEMSGRSTSGKFSENLQLFLIAVNAFFMRHFMVKRNQDNIGKGILAVTMILVMVHVALYYTGWW